ncbi:alcohol dehydrogenase catalytic domain-containing protein [Streptomyces sp. NPDC001307]|uniref:alcohol dehydrogenase catalytic domain-containing protein n=1 Tax=Streptomyces sp. NPDC001307 TaxID=3364560 RepID=UPI0036AD74A3
MLGVEGVDRVRAIGPGVQGISVGDRVVAHQAPLPGGSGFWAEQVLVAAAHTAPVPDELEPAAAAALPRQRPHCTAGHRGAGPRHRSTPPDHQRRRRHRLPGHPAGGGRRRGR